ncbi:hypothetical protein [Chishuiella sp.]|uniref:hypothetical protein n=1 Tax=Chishuiella sp. TaxID=1969467 RepID=UPI0028AF5E23|nr:hypothetical protein [Chishuiella sp.]
MIQVTGYKTEDKNISLIVEGSEMGVSFSKFDSIDLFMKEVKGKVFNSDDDLRLYIHEFISKNESERITISKFLLDEKIGYLKDCIERIDTYLENTHLTESERNFYFEKAKEYHAELKGFNWVLDNRDLFKYLLEEK